MVEWLGQIGKSRALAQGVQEKQPIFAERNSLAENQVVAFQEIAAVELAAYSDDNAAMQGICLDGVFDEFGKVIVFKDFDIAIECLE